MPINTDTPPIQENVLDAILNNNLLFGKDKEENIVGAYQRTDSIIRLFIRNGNEVTFHDEQVYPYFFLTDRAILESFIPSSGEKFWLSKLTGDNYYRYLAIFKSTKSSREALDFIAKNASAGRNESGHEDPGFIPNVYNKGDTLTQYFMQSGKTMFKGMTIEELYRMQLDIETLYDGTSGNSKETGNDEIIIISLSDNRGWEKVLHSRGRGEKELLLELIDIIEEKDPDVIEGHNIFSFDLPSLEKRCRRHNIAFSIGRDRMEPRSYPASIRFAERSIDFPFYDIPGRHVIDTLFLVQSYDVAKRSMQSYGLKAVARHFGFASPDRTYVDYSEIPTLWKSDPDRLLAYALDDVRETRELASLLSGSAFHLTQMLPYSYAMTARLGQAAKIEALLVREYLKEKHAIPRPSSGQQHTGGYTEVFLKGILGPIIYADVESLYPSIMRSYGICPKSDQLKVFPAILGELRELRLKTKAMALSEKGSGHETRAANLDAMQGSFKILINAMYGYLGFSGGLFNDFDEADRVTTTGQEIAKKMIREFESRGCRVIEVDTDGILLVPPLEVAGEEAERKLVREVSSLMPEGISIGFDGRFKKMISYMKKNYALLDYDNLMLLKGSSLTSRSGEKFGRDFVRRGFSLLLNEDIAGLHDLYTSYRSSILNHTLPISDFSRTETIKNTIEQYREDVQSGKRSRSVTYELAIRRDLPVSKGSRITYYISGSGPATASYDKGKGADEWDPEKPDENTQFYLKRLDEHCQKFLPFFKPQDYSTIFSDDTLFPFSAEGISMQKEIVFNETGN